MNSYESSDEENGERSKNLSDSSNDESEEESLSSKDSDSDDTQSSMKKDDDSDNLTEESQTSNDSGKTRKICDSVSGKHWHNSKCSTDDQSCDESSNDSDTGETSNNDSKSIEASEKSFSASESMDDSVNDFHNVKTVDKSKNGKPIAIKKYLKNSTTSKNSHASSPQPGSSRGFKKNICSETEEDSSYSGISDASGQSTDDSDMEAESSLQQKTSNFQSSDISDDYFDSDSEKHFELPQTVATKAKNESSETSEESEEDDSSEDDSGKCNDSQINHSKRKANSRTPVTKGKHEIQRKLETPRKIQVDQKTDFSHSNDDSSTNDDANEGSDDYDEKQRYSPRPKSVNKSLGSKLSNHSKLVKGNEKINNGYQRKRFSKDSENKETSKEDSDNSEISSVEEKQNKPDISSEDTDSSEENSNDLRNKSGHKFKCEKENKCFIPYKEKQKANFRSGENKKSSRHLQTKKSISSECETSENSATDDEEAKVVQKSRDEKMKCKKQRSKFVTKESPKTRNNPNQGSDKENSKLLPSKHKLKKECNKSSIDKPDALASKPSDPLKCKSKNRENLKVTSKKPKTSRGSNNVRLPKLSPKKRVLKKQSTSAVEAPIAAPKPPPPPPPPPLEEPSSKNANIDKIKNAECKTKPLKSLMPNLCNEILNFKFKKSISNGVADCSTPKDGEEVEDSKVSQTEAILTKAGIFKIDAAECKDDHPSLLPRLSGSVLSPEDKITLDIHTQLMRELLLLRGSHLKSTNQRKRNILPKEPDLLSILKTAITEHKKAKNGDSESEDSAMEDAWEDGEQITE